MSKHDQFYYNAYKKDKNAFSNWMANNIKNDIHIIDVNECRDAWNAAITAAIRRVNKSNNYNVIDKLRDLKSV